MALSLCSLEKKSKSYDRFVARPPAVAFLCLSNNKCVLILIIILSSRFNPTPKKRRGKFEWLLALGLYSMSSNSDLIFKWKLSAVWWSLDYKIYLEKIVLDRSLDHWKKFSRFLRKLYELRAVQTTSVSNILFRDIFIMYNVCSTKKKTRYPSCGAR